MGRSWIINGRGIAKKVISASTSSADQIGDSGAYITCPQCHYRIDNSHLVCKWPGLPRGVRFDPSDEDVLDHLAAKCGVGDRKPHDFLEYFIQTIEEELGINCAHPEKLPGKGVHKDSKGNFFFHKNAKAYGSGQRKRRKIYADESLNKEPVRWHKTGKTKPILHSRGLKGCKKIMVLYKSAKNGSKPEKSNWILHQYHLGTETEEASEYVVSKIFYQQHKHAEKNDADVTLGMVKLAGDVEEKDDEDEMGVEGEDLGAVNGEDVKIDAVELDNDSGGKNDEGVMVEEDENLEANTDEGEDLDVENDKIVNVEEMEESGVPNVHGAVMVGEDKNSEAENGEDVMAEGVEDMRVENDESVIVEEAGKKPGAKISPKTPTRNMPVPPRQDDPVINNQVVDDLDMILYSFLELDSIHDESSFVPAPTTETHFDATLAAKMRVEAWLLSDEYLPIEEETDHPKPAGDVPSDTTPNADATAQNESEAMGGNDDHNFALCDIRDSELGSPPDSFLSQEVRLGSQDSFGSWIDRV